MRENHYMGKLVLSLVLAIVLSLFLHARWGWDGIFLNLASEFVGITATVVFVDWLLRRHERQTWSDVHARIAGIFRTYLNGLVTSLRVSLKCGPEEFIRIVGNTDDPAAIHTAQMVLARDTLRLGVRARLERFNPGDWRVLDRNLYATGVELDKLFDRFQQRLSPKQSRTILEMQETLGHCRQFYVTFPDIAGVPDEQLPKGAKDPVTLKRFHYESTANALTRLLDLALELDGTLLEGNA